MFLITLVILFAACEREVIVPEQKAEQPVLVVKCEQTSTVEDAYWSGVVNARLDELVARKLSQTDSYIPVKGTDSSVTVAYFLPYDLNNVIFPTWFPSISVGLGSAEIASFSCVIESDTGVYFEYISLQTYPPMFDWSNYSVAYAVYPHFIAFCAYTLNPQTITDPQKRHIFLIQSHGHGNIWWSKVPDDCVIGMDGYNNFLSIYHDGNIQ